MSIRGRWKQWLISSACLTIIVMTGCGLLPKEEEALAPPLVKPAKPNITTVEVKKSPIEQAVRGVGFLEPYEIIYHQFKDSGGMISEKLVKSGDLVQKGDPLIQLNVDGLDLEIKYKRLDLEKAIMGLEAARDAHDEKLMLVKMLELDIAQTNYDRAVDKLESRILRAEMDGMVTFITDKKTPDTVQPYENLVVVADTKKLRLILERSDTNVLSGVELGMEAELVYKSTTYKGTVTQTPGSAPVTTDTFLRDRYNKSIYIDVEELPEESKIGETMNVKVVTKKQAEALIIPVQALRTFMSRNYVQVLEGERIFEADVEVGLRTSTEVEIVSGLQEGQQIILR